MSQYMTKCPSDQTFRLISVGQWNELSQIDIDQVARHIRSCKSCAQRASRLGAQTPKFELAA